MQSSLVHFNSIGGKTTFPLKKNAKVQNDHKAQIDERRWKDFDLGSMASDVEIFPRWWIFKTKA